MVVPTSESAPHAAGMLPSTWWEPIIRNPSVVPQTVTSTCMHIDQSSAMDTAAAQSTNCRSTLASGEEQGNGGAIVSSRFSQLFLDVVSSQIASSNSSLLCICSCSRLTSGSGLLRTGVEHAR
mmetsp:Transcript_117315/g.304505  ORF Transcript_117315/g.304505 Transcript_117315/m.304505 type:complete len:123 (+) Transcript_117315:583-951(+)